MGDSFTVMSQESWGSRLLASIKGILFGLLLFIVAFPVLIWNEGRAVRTAQSLAEGAAAVIQVPATAVDPGNAGKLVYVTGRAVTSARLSDPEFGVSARAIKLERAVTMYQWQESQSSHSEKELGGGTKTVTTYTYGKTWSAMPIDSSMFARPAGHENPTSMAVAAETWTASPVTLGAFTLPGDLLAKMNRAAPLPQSPSALAGLADDLRGRAHLQSGGYYIGANPDTPAIGDLRVRFKEVLPATVSVAARQVGQSFEPYAAKAGGTVLLLDYGTVSPATMFRRAERSNRILTWILRGAGFSLMALGLFLILNPLAVLADVIPFFGSLLRSGIGIVVFLLALALSFITIALAWLAYRPLLAVGLLAAAAAGLVALVHLAHRRRAAHMAARAGS